MTCPRATSEGPSRSDEAGEVLLTAGLPAGLPGLAGCLAAGFAAGLARTGALRSVRATCAVPAGGGARLAARNFGISRVAQAETAVILRVAVGVAAGGRAGAAGDFGLKGPPVS